MTNDPRAQSEQPNSEPSRLENVKWPVSLADWLTIRAEIARLNARANHYGYCNLHGHHLGYECPECPYEAAIAATRAENAALVKLVEVAKCPNCDGSGVIVVETTGIEPGCCGHPNRDGSCCGNAIPVQTQEQEQQPCQWCDERSQALRAGQQKGTANE